MEGGMDLTDWLMAALLRVTNLRTYFHTHARITLLVPERLI
jgi:hypothetical protein